MEAWSLRRERHGGGGELLLFTTLHAELDGLAVGPGLFADSVIHTWSIHPIKSHLLYNRTPTRRMRSLSPRSLSIATAGQRLSAEFPARATQPCSVLHAGGPLAASIQEGNLAASTASISSATPPLLRGLLALLALLVLGNLMSLVGRAFYRLFRLRRPDLRLRARTLQELDEEYTAKVNTLQAGFDRDVRALQMAYDGRKDLVTSALPSPSLPPPPPPLPSPPPPPSRLPLPRSLPLSQPSPPTAFGPRNYYQFRPSVSQRWANDIMGRRPLPPPQAKRGTPRKSLSQGLADRSMGAQQSDSRVVQGTEEGERRESVQDLT